ncbi:MAG: hypothetical protein H5T60_07340 [Anaerolineae bacterium]|nr:hypothetical protein [Anaerolineae bacterium]
MVDIFTLLDSFRSIIFCAAFIIPDLAVHFNRAVASKRVTGISEMSVTW